MFQNCLSTQSGYIVTMLSIKNLCEKNLKIMLPEANREVILTSKNTGRERNLVYY